MKSPLSNAKSGVYEKRYRTSSIKKAKRGRQRQKGDSAIHFSAIVVLSGWAALPPVFKLKQSYLKQIRKR
ncbi:MAG TPA: hypothetical protein DCW74_19065 [Alteromonas australica]|uniref:Uncharacterized protein n=1 Tax=Alteromonas australica TaxID=589873 RepID=A0A350P955_9ALTE|nr:hypothetical protein [Alteromonas australica]